MLENDSFEASGVDRSVGGELDDCDIGIDSDISRRHRRTGELGQEPVEMKG